MTIKELEKHSLPIIKTLAHEIWPEVYDYMISQEQIAYMLQHMYNLPKLEQQLAEGHRFFVLYDEQDVALGFAAYQALPDYSRLHKLYLKANLQGRGYGKLLVDHCISLTKADKKPWLELNVNRSNKAVSFYKKMGFHVVKSEDIPFGENYVLDDYVMQYTID